jgi:hypothetical protein
MLCLGVFFEGCVGWSSTKFIFFVQYGIQDGGYGMTWFNIRPYGKNVLKDIWDN